MNQTTLIIENEHFAGTRGVSQNAGPGFRPAFLDKATGRVELARYASGQIACVHVFSGLPREWAESLDEAGAIASLRPEIIAGFESEGVFFTREEVAGLER